MIKRSKKLTSSPKAKITPKSVALDSTSVDKQMISPNIRNLVELRQNETIQAQVQQRFEELTLLNATGTDTKIKSQRGGVDIFVKNHGRWPHEHILSGSNKERISYDQLTVLQWVTGFRHTTKKEQNSKLREHMLDYMISLLEDAQDFSWEVAKAILMFYYAEWNRGKFEISLNLTKLTELEEPNYLTLQFISLVPASPSGYFL